MTTKVRITSDRDKVYQDGQVLTANQLISDYIETSGADKSEIDWLCQIPIANAIDFIAGMWGFTYYFI